MSDIHPHIKNMSKIDMERTIFDILTDNGMDEDTADKTIDGMSLRDMEKYLSDVEDALDEVKEDEEDT